MLSHFESGFLEILNRSERKSRNKEEHMPVTWSNVLSPFQIWLKKTNNIKTQILLFILTSVQTDENKLYAENNTLFNKTEVEIAKRILLRHVKFISSFCVFLSNVFNDLYISCHNTVSFILLISKRSVWKILFSLHSFHEGFV